ncbi:tripartite tricarboxylate transporter substrate binding protein [Natranaerobius trueperi]|uniref:tripartite tricarboxylate transporter substrate binding protein n=1 Tax=Natranaerobius trueperi TaxID=759412 RepID=UPI0013034040|nr:tripartite tricarboxylate transporter substrate binding protein [Natranaerobius trueperi]
MFSKKIGVLLLSIVLIFTFAACDGGTETTGGNEGTEYPKDNIEIIVPSGTGGSLDVTARALAAHAEEHLGTNVIVENIPGASFTIGVQHVLDSDPDGYTILVTADTAFAYIPLGLADEVDYTYEDIEPVSRIAMNQNSIAINADTAEKLGIEDLEDLLEYSKENPGELTVGYSSMLYDVWRLSLKELGHDLNVVHQDSGGQAATQTAGGHIDVYFGAMPGILPYYEDNKVEMLATLPYESKEEIPAIDEYPEVDDALGMSKYGPISAYAPKDTPDEILDFLDESFKEISQDESFIEMIEGQGLELFYQDRKEFQSELETLCQEAKEFEDVLKNLR